MPQYWLKPLGVTDPPSPMPDDWTAGADLDRFSLRTGPATVQNPPQMGRGDRVLFHAVIHVKLFAEAELTGNPEYRKDPEWGLRWPWVYPCRIDTWVPLIQDGVSTTDAVPRRAMGRVQAGGEYAKLTEAEYWAAAEALRAMPTVEIRGTGSA